MRRPVIIKVGGSLLQHGNGTILQRVGKTIAHHCLERPLLIVPGGGPFADLVRQCWIQLKLSEPICHFMALSAMDQYAYLLHEFIPDSGLTDLTDVSIKRLKSTESPQSSKPQILLCSHFLRHTPAEELPRTWHVTSDSIAAYLARKMDSSLLVILKSKDINKEIQEPDVDPFFPQLLPLNMPVWFINGLYPERLVRFFRTGYTQGVYLPPNNFSAQSTL